MEEIKKSDEELYEFIKLEESRQRNNIELIASENFVSKAIMEAMGTILTNKYAEGYPGKRYYGGCENIDKIESLAIDRVKRLFGAEHANVQAHSGSQANMAVYMSVLKPGDKILGMQLSSGGHLTHGSRVNFSGKIYEVMSYGLNEQGYIDYDEVEKMAIEFKPKMIVAGASAYSRKIDFKKFKEIADKVGAYLLVDMAHIAGLVCAGKHMSPVPYADFVTSTTHKTLRGPRGGLILCKEKYAKDIDKTIFPGIQGGPFEHIIAAKAICFKEALDPSFTKYIEQVILNCKVLGEELVKRGYDLVSGGTDNHLILVDLTSSNMLGQEAEELLDEVNITVNKNSVPNDNKLNSKEVSGIRIGTAACTTKGLNEEDMIELAEAIDLVLCKNKKGLSEIDFNNNKEESIKIVKKLTDKCIKIV